MNAINVIHPYCRDGIWAFDDKAKGLEGEPFLAGIPEIIAAITAREAISEPEDGFTLIFSGSPFPGHQAVLRFVSSDGPGQGNWYLVDGANLEGWLCPALFCYFDEAPKTIYVQAKDLAPGAGRHPAIVRARTARQRCRQAQA